MFTSSFLSLFVFSISNIPIYSIKPLKFSKYDLKNYYAKLQGFMNNCMGYHTLKSVLSLYLPV